MVDTARFRVLHPEVEIGSTIHRHAKVVAGAGDAFYAHGSNGTLVKLKHGLVHRDGVAAVNVSPKGLYITTSFLRDPREPGSPNVHPPTSESAAYERLTLIESHLSSLGLRVDFLECTLSRVDVFKDVRVEGGYGEYAEAMQVCDLQKLSPTDLAKIAAFGEKVDKRSRVPLAAHTYGRTLNHRAVIAYSKPQHLHTQKAHREYAGRVITDLDGDDVVRFEGRYLKAAAVRNNLAVASGADLIAAWDTLPSHLEELVDDTFGIGVEDGGAPVTAGCGLSERLRALVMIHGRGQKTALLTLAAAYLESELAKGGGVDLEYLRAVLRDAGMRKREIDGLLSDLASAICPSGTRTIGKRLDSLRDSLHGASYLWPAS